MGANLSLLAPNAHTVALRSYVDVLPNFRFLEVVNNTRFLKTIKAYDISSGTLVILKVFIKPPQTAIRLHDVTEKLAQEASLLSLYPNLLAWSRIFETDSAGYLVRQMVKTNLYDRLSLRPFLSPVEKRWIVFQMLRTLELLHDHLHICHGDLKTENFLVTSSNWLLLADFAQHTKPVYLPDDNPSEFVFYFDSSNRRACYVAPERFYDKSKQQQLLKDRQKWRLSPTADLFSLGCVIAELYMDGEPPFTLSDLYRYRKGGMEPNLSGISDPEIQKMTKSLLSLDPKARMSALEILSLFRDTFFPMYFYENLYDTMAYLNTSKSFAVSEGSENSSPSDLKIDWIYSHFDKISHELDLTFPSSKELDRTFPYLKLNLKGMTHDHVVTTARSSNRGSSKPNQGALILLDMVFSLVRTVRRPSNKIKSCELILAFSEHISDEAKLDRSLPYLCSFLDEFMEKVSSETESYSTDLSSFPRVPTFSSNVASVSLLAVTNLLESCSGFNPINAHVFPDFIYPKLKSLAFLNNSMKDEISHVKSTLAACLPSLTKISERFMVFASKIPSKVGQLGSSSEKVVGAVTTRCENDIKDITEAILTDPNVNVRIRLIANILPICQFFGVDKTNDVILPHLITYLNDTSILLRLTFLSSIKSIGSFIGVLAFEQYLLPLLIQTLADQEPFIVLKVLEIFNYFVSERLINPSAQFNALSIYKELLENTMMLLLQPNEWIRQSTIYLILSISENLLNADRFCFLYPLIKSYLTYDVSSFTWDVLYPCLTKSISRQIFEIALKWLSSSQGKSLFWKQKDISSFKSNGRKNLVTYSKDMGKSIYIGKMSTNSFIGKDSGVSDTALSHTDRQWILKMKSYGMADTDFWKIAALRRYFIGINKAGSYNESGDHRDFELATKINISPLNILCDVRYKSELLDRRQTGTSFHISPLKSCREGSVIESTSGALSLAPVSKAKASLQTNESNIFAELNTTHEEFSYKNPHQHTHERHYEKKYSGQNLIHRVFCTTDDKIISVTLQHNFSGDNPHILTYLQLTNFKPTLDDFPEFGAVIKENRENEVQMVHPIAIKGTQIAHINTNTSSNSIEAITKVTLSPSSEFLVSGSETGALKIWDTNKLEAASAKAAALTQNLGSEIKDIVFLPDRLVFAVATLDGQIRLFKVHVVRGKTKRIIKFSKLTSIREFKLDEGHAKSISFTHKFSRELLVAITSTCRVVAYDVIKTNPVFQLNNSPQYGLPISHLVSSVDPWILLGTTEGVLCLWDIRYGILLKSWEVETNLMNHTLTGVKKLISITSRQTSIDRELFAMIGGANEQDVTIWEVPTFECIEIFCAHQVNPTLRKYLLKDVDSSMSNHIDRSFAKFSLNFDHAPSKCNTSLAFLGQRGNEAHEKGYIATSTTENRITIWNLNNISQSSLVVPDGGSTFTKNEISSRLTISYEKRAGNQTNARSKLREPHSEMTDIAIATYPFPMLVAAEQNGSISVYK